MNKRSIGQEGISVSEIGLGTWQFCNQDSWQGPNEYDVLLMIKEAINKGCNFFDTAPNYASGESEKALGFAIDKLDIRQSVFINTKFGHWPNGQVDFSVKRLEESVKSSLKRLQTNYLDGLVLHNPSQEILKGETEHFEVLDNLKKTGVIKHYGASVDTPEEMMMVMEHSNADLIEVMFNMIHQSPREAFDKAKEKNISIIVKVPLDSGWLTGKYDEKSVFSGIRNRWSREEIANRSNFVKEIKGIIGDKDIIKSALQFILSYDAVTTIIPGAKNISQLTHNLSASGESLSIKEKKAIEKLYDEKFKNMAVPW